MALRTRLPKAAQGRTVLVGSTLIVFCGALIALVFATRESAPPTASLGLPVPASVPVAAHFPVSTSSTRRPVPTSAPTTNPHPSTTIHVGLVVTPPASGPPVTSAPVPTPTTGPVPTTGPRTLMAPAITATLPPPPPALGPKSLTWTAPGTLTIPHDSTSPLTVIAQNGTDRTVDLPHPLSCTPRLDHTEACAPEVQQIAPHTSVRATYTIDALGVAPGRYTLSIEGVLTVAVTVS